MLDGAGLRDGKTYAGQEILIERQDGSRWTVLAHASPFLDDRGKVVGAVNVFVDITDRRRAEMTRSHLAAIIDSTDDAIVSKDLNGVIQSWNGAAERLFGYTAEQAIGRHISFLFPPDRLNEEDQIWRDCGPASGSITSTQSVSAATASRSKFQ